MWAAVVEVEPPRHFGRGRGVGAAMRYAGVLAVWLGLALVRPRLALDLWRSRRRRPVRSWPSGLTAESQRRVLRSRR